MKARSLLVAGASIALLGAGAVVAQADDGYTSTKVNTGATSRGQLTDNAAPVPNRDGSCDVKLIDARSLQPDDYHIISNNDVPAGELAVTTVRRIPNAAGQLTVTSFGIHSDGSSNICRTLEQSLALATGAPVPPSSTKCLVLTPVPPAVPAHVAPNLMLSTIEELLGDDTRNQDNKVERVNC